MLLETSCVKFSAPFWLLLLFFISRAEKNLVVDLRCFQVFLPEVDMKKSYLWSLTNYFVIKWKHISAQWVLQGLALKRKGNNKRPWGQNKSQNMSTFIFVVCALAKENQLISSADNCHGKLLIQWLVVNSVGAPTLPGRSCGFPLSSVAVKWQMRRYLPEIRMRPLCNQPRSFYPLIPRVIGS